MADLVGQTLKGRYHIDELLGRGGMAEVYKAWDMRRQYHVAVKVMREDLAEDLEFVQRFRREARALAALSHANIVRFYSFEQDGRLAFIVMDYVVGTSLRGRIFDAHGSPLPLDEAMAITRQVCAALHYAHQENVLHRDVKPGNIMLEPGGRVLVTDFGIAKAADSATATTVMPGTPAYMSPEQCRSQPLDARSDVYSLGIVVYEMLAGRRPFVGDTEAMTGSTRERIRWEQIHADPPPLCRFNAAVPPGIFPVVLRALAKEPDERWSTPLAFWRALEESFRLGEMGAVAAVSCPTPEPVSVVATNTPMVPLPDTTTLTHTATDRPSPTATATSLPPTATATPKPRAPAGRIVFYTFADGDSEIYVMNLDGSGMTRLTRNSASDWDPALSPDGRQIAFGSDRDGSSAIYVMNTDGSGVTQLTNSGGGPTWSPDGQRIAFSSNRDGDAEIYVMNADGSRVTRLTDNAASDYSPAWSPDGRRIAFVSEREGNSEIYVMNADGGGVTRLTNNPRWDQSPSWAPDGQRITFWINTGHDSHEIYIMNADGSSQTKLHDSAYAEQDPCWMPNGKQIVFASVCFGTWEIVRADVDGNNLTRLTRIGSGNPALVGPSCSR